MSDFQRAEFPLFTSTQPMRCLNVSPRVVNREFSRMDGVCPACFPYRSRCSLSALARIRSICRLSACGGRNRTLHILNTNRSVTSSHDISDSFFILVLNFILILLMLFSTTFMPKYLHVTCQQVLRCAPLQVSMFSPLIFPAIFFLVCLSSQSYTSSLPCIILTRSFHYVSIFLATKT